VELFIFDRLVTSIQHLFGIRMHHDAAPDIGKRSAFSRPMRPPCKIGSFSKGATLTTMPHGRVFLPEKLNLKSAKTVKPYVTSAWICS
jgi:hypothetical protein